MAAALLAKQVPYGLKMMMLKLVNNGKVPPKKVAVNVQGKFLGDVVDILVKYNEIQRIDGTGCASGFSHQGFLMFFFLFYHVCHVCHSYLYHYYTMYTCNVLQLSSMVFANAFDFLPLSFYCRCTIYKLETQEQTYTSIQWALA